MKKIGLLISMLIVSTITFSQTLNSPEELGKLVFEALKTKNQKLFKKAWTKKAELKYGLNEMMKYNGKTDQKIDDNELDQAHAKYMSNIEMSFTQTLENGEAEGIKWDEIVYSKTDYFSRSGPKDGPIEIGKIYLEIIYKKRIYSIKIGDSLKIKGNWTIEDAISWKGLADE